MAKQRISNYKFFPGVSSDDNLFPNAYSLIQSNKQFIIKEAVEFISNSIITDTNANLYPSAVARLTANKEFLKEEITAWIAAQALNNVFPFSGFTYDAAKCKRDVGYVVDAYIHDVRYGGNEKTQEVVKNYWTNGVAQVDGDRTPEAYAHDKLKSIIIENILTNTPYSTQQSPIAAAQNTSGTVAEFGVDTQVASLASIVVNVISNGLSALPVAYSLKPNAVSLLTNNKEFLQDEITAWIAAEVDAGNPPFVGFTYNKLKCKRDVGYVVDAYIHDLQYGGNEKTVEVVRQYWLDGTAQIDGDRLPEVAAHTQLALIINNYILTRTTYTSQQDPIVTVQDTTGGAAEAGSTEQISNLSTIVISVIEDGLTAITDLNIYPNAVAQLTANKEFLKDEIVAWITAQVSGNIEPFIGYTYNSIAFKTTVGNIIDSYIYGLKYNSDAKTREVAQKFWIGNTAQITGSRSPEIAAYTKLRDIIDGYILTNALYTSQQSPITSVQDRTGLAGELVADDRVDVLSNIVINTITSGLSALGTPPSRAARNFSAYIYDTSKCERDTGYVLDAYLHDLRYGGNMETRFVVSRYWEGSVAQIDGDRRPEVVTHKFIRDLINLYIITQDAYTPLQVEVARVTNIALIGEPASTTRISALYKILSDVITNGLSSLPAVENGVTTIKIQGHYTLNTLLLITNTSNNQILYNFSDPNLGGSVNLETAYNSNGLYRDEDFPAFLQVADYVTTITLSVDTTSSSETDDIQIFVEQAEMKIRPYDFGTDAIERMRVATPQSMLDADFEYGLQPTKWQAIGIARGYPSVYEVPGTDTAVVTVITDASTGTAGVGQSLITVTTSGPHGFIVGQPITIRALANTISGFSRAEGTFLINSIPTTTTFTYYAVSKVGTLNGQVLATTYTQLRKASFYTGASIGSPAFSVLSNGTIVTIDTKFDTAQGSDQLAFVGTPPAIGSPLTGSGIALGSQVAGVVGSGGLLTTATVRFDADISDTTVTVADPTGILEGAAIDNGTGTAIFVSSINGQEVSFSAPLTAGLLGDTQTYTNVVGTNIDPAGLGVEFTVQRTGGIYATVTVTTPGSGYVTNDRIKLLGSSLGGISPDNDISIIINTVDGLGGVDTFTYLGTSISGNDIYLDLDPTSSTGSGSVAYTGILQDATTGTGSSAVFSISRSISGYVPSVTTAGSGYAVNDTVTVNGSQLGGSSPGNNLVITVTGTRATYLSTAQNATNGSGTSALFNVTRLGDTYSTTLNSGGNNYAAGNTVTIFGTQLGGASPTNDLTITVNAVTATYNGLTQDFTSGSGTNAVFNVVRNGTTYFVTIANPGSGYLTNDTVKIFGSNLGGSSPANDLTITITGAFSGEITNIIVSGTASGTGSITSISPGIGIATGTGGIYTLSSTGVAVTGPSVGVGATFDVTRSSGNYAVVVATAGTNYEDNDTLTISGTLLGGTSPTNDLTITITAIGTSGEIVDFTSLGAAIDSDAIFTGVAGNNVIPVGIGASFNVTRSAAAYSAIVNLPGSNYQIGDKILISATSLGGTVPFNDAIAEVTSVSGGQVISVSLSGTAIDGQSLEFYSAISFTELTTAIVPDATTLTASPIAVMRITWPSPHGLVPGASILVDINSTGTNHDLAKGPFYVENVPTANTLTYTARAVGTVDTTTLLSGTVYARPDSYFIHRPYDGGVQLGTGGPQHGAQAIRMSKKYIRYQSGKGIMYTTGALFAPSYNLQNLFATGLSAGSFITVVTDDVDHGCQVGGVIRIIGVETAGYNGTYTVADVVNERTLRVQAQSVLASTQATLGTEAQMSIKSWHGATVRAGCFDEQNGMFWQYDGKDLAVGRRTSTFQLAGVVNIQRDTNLMTGTNTRFRDQVKAGDRVVIKGMTHVVTNVTSQTSMTVNPDYRGATDALQSKLCLVQDIIIPQREFNLDRLDGTGPSGYNLDISKMQMIGLQYTWYGAGFIDYMLRGSDGNYVFAHRIRNSNVNTEAFMRTGNLPVRYEVINESGFSKLANSVTATQTTIPLVDASNFPNEAGTISIENELIAFTGKNGNTLTGCTRSAPMTNFVGGAQRTVRGGTASTHEVGTGVVLVSNTISPIISHWGSAFLTDGRFDEDRGYIFNYAASNIAVSTTKQTAFLIRLAPSVSNAIVGDLGERELLNRAQLLLKEIAITTDAQTSNAGGVVIEGVLNPQNYPTNPSDIAWSGLQGSAQGGQPSFAQIAPGGSVSWSGGGSQTTSPATTQAAMTGTLTPQPVFGSNRALLSGYNRFYVTDADYATYIANGLTTGDRLSGTGIAANTVITSFRFYGNISGINYYEFTMNLNATANVTAPASITATRSFTTSSTSTIFFQRASWESNGAKAGTEVSDVLFPAGTFVSTSTLTSFFGTQYYRVTFSQTSTTAAITAGTTTVTFKFGLPPYAQPGETVFSFVSATGQNSALDLSELKELTNTTLGGRGTYPNGPDVLAINVYKTAGTVIPANIVLRWGEAQA